MLNADVHVYSFLTFMYLLILPCTCLSLADRSNYDRERNMGHQDYYTV